uniref:Uncharacterized protein n=1 Tax=viral metagenome TaxID=1070528 RepID=A0A6C0CAY6_9ZZZZ
MNVINEKRIKPTLVDPYVRQKIIKTIKPSKVNYWGPTKNAAQYFYEDYIRPNLFSVILIGIFVMILIYRYTLTQKDKLLRELNNEEKIKNPDLDMAMLLYRYQKEMSLEPENKTKVSYPIYPYVNNVR